MLSDSQIPLSVPEGKLSEYKKNYRLATAGTGRLLLFAGDQKVEHLNDDFFGPNIAKDDASPEHLFKIAASTKGVLFATHLGLISQYGYQYDQVPYLVKMNGKTNLGPNEDKDSSRTWWTIDQIVKFKKQSGLKIVGVGYTLYLGGRYEAEMLAEAAQLISAAHQQGLIAVLWVYPRGQGIKEENIHTIAGGAGVAACLDADFVKLKYPYSGRNPKLTIKKYQEVIQAAGRTKIICVGGSQRETKELLATTKLQLANGLYGLAIGRNLHQRPLGAATKLTADLAKIIHAPTKTKKTNSKFLGLF